MSYEYLELSESVDFIFIPFPVSPIDNSFDILNIPAHTDTSFSSAPISILAIFEPLFDKNSVFSTPWHLNNNPWHNPGWVSLISSGQVSSVVELFIVALNE